MRLFIMGSAGVKLWFKCLFSSLLLTFLTANAQANTVRAYVLVSFSMPDTLLREVLQEAASLHLPTLLNGLYHNSMRDTAEKIYTLSKVVPNLELQIDPTVFERYAIHQVPALVVEKGAQNDVIFGNLTIREGLSRISRQGETGLTNEDIKGLNHG